MGDSKQAHLNVNMAFAEFESSIKIVKNKFCPL